MTSTHSGSGTCEPRRIYQNFFLDNTAWRKVDLRPDDIVISSAPRSGTTWTQMIVALLVFQRIPLPAPLDRLSYFIERRMDSEALLTAVREQMHRRFLQSHMPFDGIPDAPYIKKLFIARDPRDMALSLWNFHRHLKPEAVAKINEIPNRVGPPMPILPEQFDTFFRIWLTQGGFPGDTEGWPGMSPIRMVQSWWERRTDPNVLLVHYNDLSTDLQKEMRRIAAFLDIVVPEERWPDLVGGAMFDAMKNNAAEISPQLGGMFKGGAQDFIYKGGGGRWKELLSDRDLEAYRTLFHSRLPADCAHWLENGGSLD